MWTSSYVCYSAVEVSLPSAPCPLAKYMLPPSMRQGLELALAEDDRFHGPDATSFGLDFPPVALRTGVAPSFSLALDVQVVPLAMVMAKIVGRVPMYCFW